MDDDADQQHPTGAGAPGTVPAYPRHQLARALLTSLTHADVDTRRRAEARADRWRAVLAGGTDGRLTVGSRTPVAGLPAWVTPEVVRGGFATSAASAEGPLQPYEREAAVLAGVPAERAALFAHCLTEPGLARLNDLLDTGRYEVTVPEEAALLTVAWLLRAGDTAAALDLLDTLEPFAARLRFTPRPAILPPPDPEAVHRRTVGDAVTTLVSRRPNTAVGTQREALTVWQPFADRLLTHWLEAADDTGRLPERLPGGSWRKRGALLLHQYEELAAAHTRCTKHRSPKENLGILRGALAEAVAGRALDARRLGLLRHAVDSMLRRRGRPGSAAHTDLRARHAVQAALPSHHDLAQLVLRRLAVQPQEVGAAEVEPLVADVSVEEAEETGLPVGAVVPAAVRHVVEATLSAPIGTLVERGVVPSAEVLAELVPQLVAATSAEAHPDAALRTLAAANYRAFRNRRSLLLLNLASQVRIEELPWVRAVAAHRADEDGRGPARVALRRLGELAVQAFPGTLLPNPLVRELAVLARQSGADAPLVEELAADIFMGAFSPKFVAAAGVAADLLEGTLYERYYGIDYAALREAGESGEAGPGRFAELCARRAGTGPEWSVTANGMVIEQAQILTTHNLATLVARVGISPSPGWEDLARRSFATVCRKTARIQGNPRPRPAIKDAAYAWRHLVFQLSLCTVESQERTVAGLYEELARHPAHVAARLARALTGLGQAAAGGSASEGKGRVLLGWTTGRHWMCSDPWT
ncbi:hypothetical protein [Streptomyces sp. CBMA156]|uniref:hypothetical protein n=1 Tax=Streptomyces sp. CBMA156 TaxID=1930280 RepID=UPI0016619814|nr:hypothetical protein [Streptomyces sp. CBMA156]MBD0673147.1 hypothetical protein [Streptomyces sp. CBMA156]